MIQGTYTLQVSVNKLAEIKTLKWREFLQSNWVSLPATLIDINDATRDRFQSVVLPWTSLSFNKMLFPNWIYYLLFSFKRIFSWILINAWLLMLHNSLMTCSQILTLDKCSTPQFPSKHACHIGTLITSTSSTKKKKIPMARNSNSNVCSSRKNYRKKFFLDWNLST